MAAVTPPINGHTKITSNLRVNGYSRSKLTQIIYFIYGNLNPTQSLHMNKAKTLCAKYAINEFFLFYQGNPNFYLH